MPVYKATKEDKQLIYDMALKFLNRSPYAKLWSAESLDRLIDNVLANGVLLLDKDHKGMIGGIIVPFIYNDYFQAIELCWWVDEDARLSGLGKELLQAFEDWANEEGCKYITMISLDDQVGKVYEKLGYSLMERTYMKEI